MKFAEQRISNPPRNKKTPVGVLLAHSLGNASRESLLTLTKKHRMVFFWPIHSATLRENPSSAQQKTPNGVLLAQKEGFAVNKLTPQTNRHRRAPAERRGLQMKFADATHLKSSAQQKNTEWCSFGAEGGI